MRRVLSILGALILLTTGLTALLNRTITLNIREESNAVITRTALINFILAVAITFFIFSLVVLCLALANEIRRKGRSEVRRLLARNSYGVTVAIKICGDAILQALSRNSFLELAALPVGKLVNDHLVDQTFNVNLFRYLDFKLKAENTNLTLESIQQTIASIEAWHEQAPSVVQALDFQIRNYAGVETNRDFKKALYFLNRRTKYFEAIFDTFIVEIKTACVSAMARHMA